MDATVVQQLSRGYLPRCCYLATPSELSDWIVATSSFTVASPASLAQRIIDAQSLDQIGSTNWTCSNALTYTVNLWTLSYVEDLESFESSKG